MTNEEAAKQLEDHLMKALDQDEYSIPIDDICDDYEQCASDTIEALNIALIALRKPTEGFPPYDLSRF